MKKIFRLSLAAAALLALSCSCSKVENEQVFQGFSLDKTEIPAGPHGLTDTLKIMADGAWTAELPESCSWIKVIPSMGEGPSECLIDVDSSVTVDVRQAMIRFTSGRDSKNLKVVQLGYAKSIIIDTAEVNIASSMKKKDRHIDRILTTNVSSFRMVFKNDQDQPVRWLSSKQDVITPEREYGDRPTRIKVRFDWNINPAPEERIAKVEFVPVHQDEALPSPVFLTVNQAAAPLIEDNAKGDSLALLIIQERLNAMFKAWDGSESIKTWKNVLLWEDGDTLPSPDALGRVRAFKIQSINLDETIPEEVKHLKYAEEIIIMSNANTFHKYIELGPEICELEHLKYLTLGSIGITKLPPEFEKLGKKLVYLNLWGNNLEEIPDYLNPVRFPELRALDLVGNSRWTIRDLREKDQGRYAADGLGLYINTERRNNPIERLLAWGDKMEYLNLSNNIFEGQIPDFQVGDEILIDPASGQTVKLRAYTPEDKEIKEMGDTLAFLLTPEGQKIPRILPNAYRASFNLCFLTGKVPDWILYHPFLIRLDAPTLMYNQRIKSYDSKGRLAGLDGVPANFDYYFEKYPLYKGKYLIPEDKQ